MRTCARSPLLRQAALEEAVDAREGVASVVGSVSEHARRRLRDSLAQLAGVPQLAASGEAE
jgi:hypothetical protein